MHKHNQTNNTLIVGPAWVGDMVMAQTLFKLLKQNQAQQKIDVLAPDWTRPLLDRMPEVNQAIALPLKHGEFGLQKRFQLGKQLAQQHYSQAIVLPNSWKSALVPTFANIKKRTGWRGEMRWGLLNDIRLLDKNSLPLMIQRFAALAYDKSTPLPKQLPHPKLVVDTETVTNACQRHQLNPNQKPILALCPGAEFGPSKCWPAEYFADIANKKINEGWQVWLFGSNNDADIAASIQQATQQQCTNLVGETTLAEAIDLLSLSQLVLSNDSGLMHIAAALQKPLVAIYGSTSPDFTPPLSDNVKIIRLNLKCSPCFKRQCPLDHLNCLKQISPELVSKAMTELKPCTT